MNPFRPVPAGTVSIDVSDTSQSVSLGIGASADAIRVMNDGSATVWINFGDADVEADSAKDIPVGPGVVELVSAQNNDGSLLYVAAIAAGATGKIYFTPGIGI